MSAEATFADPVHLIGYALHGQIVDGAGWEESTMKEFYGLLYRRIIRNPAPGSVSQAVCFGPKENFA